MKSREEVEEVEEVVKEWTYFEREPPRIGRPSREGISWLVLFVCWMDERVLLGFGGGRVGIYMNKNMDAKEV